MKKLLLLFIGLSFFSFGCNKKMEPSNTRQGGLTPANRDKIEYYLCMSREFYYGIRNIYPVKVDVEQKKIEYILDKFAGCVETKKLEN